MSVRIALGGAAEEAVGRVLPRLVDEKVASGITGQDASLWGAAAETDAARGLGWTESVAASRELVAPITALRRDLRRAGADRVLLLAPAGAARAASMIAGTQGVDLAVVEPDDPAAVRSALQEAADTVVVVAGADAAVLALVVRTVHDLGVDPARRVVVVARAGSSLDADARATRLTTVPWERGVGDRFSALSAPALVAAGLAGADLAELLDEAESEELNLAIDDRANNGLRLGAALGGSRPAGVAVVTDGTHLVGADRWAAHLLAGAGLQPRALRRDAPELVEASVQLQVLRLVDDAHAPARIAPHEIRLSGSLGELILALQYTAAVAAWLRGADPFSEESA
ncbi:hypothetical protein [Amnibacterium sp.]|uniref:hypothetical protein n=1 Tax=Amnibacterium sp. TaxID=1872496 RepID=UPI00260A4605|nr:hypothetical protein [Amnibacterium sp.]MCU1473931.1 glucose-6-phosphate isomerase [Amnibacterium sp.]